MKYSSICIWGGGGGGVVFVLFGGCFVLFVFLGFFYSLITTQHFFSIEQLMS